MTTATPATMRAVAVLAGKAETLHLRDMPRPRLENVPDGRGVLVRMIRVGVCGTDREVVEALYGEPPKGDDFLVIGHENLGRVEAVGPGVQATLAPGTLVVATVRRPGSSPYDRIGMIDMSTGDDYLERGINRAHGFLAEWYADDSTYLVPVPDALEPVAVLLEPTSVVEKGIRQAFEIQRRLHIWAPERAAVIGAGPIGLLAALALRLRGIDVVVYSRRPGPYRNSQLVEALGGTYVSSSTTALDDLASAHGPFDIMLDASGYSPLAIEAARVLGKNGVLVLASVTGGNATAELPTDVINQGFVLGNKVMVGTVNAHHDDFVGGVADLLQAEAFHPGWLGQLITTRVRGLDRHDEMVDLLRNDRDAIKVVVEIA